MSDLNMGVNASSFPLRRKAGVKRIKKHILKIDMTPMVDLGFLLISFFVITTELSRPKTMNLYMPFDGPSMPTAKSKTITFLAGGNNKLFYYFGEEKDAGILEPIFETSWDEKNGIGKIIREKQLLLDNVEGGRDEMMIIIKAGKESTYKNAVDILDEMTIHDIKRYAIVKTGAKEEQYLKKNK